jgi:glucose-6-phosphate 1-epimerase
MWNQQFTLLYSITLSSNSITTSFQVQNQGDETFQFQALLHTYFHLRDIQQTTVSGLSGRHYTDQLLDGDKVLQPPESVLSFTQETDRIFLNAPSQVTLTGLSLRSGKEDDEAKTCSSSSDGSVTIDIQVEGGVFKTHDLVIWNPWVEKSKRMSDFGDEEYHNMCCVEPGFIGDWQQLGANDIWKITQTLTVTEVEEAGETKL